MNSFRLIATLLIAGVAFTFCVSPFYGTARIEEGWHMDVGVAATSFMGWIEWFPYCVGGRGDFEIRYGFSQYFGVSSRVGLGYGLDIQPKLPPAKDTYFTGDVAIGVQAAYPFEYLTPALRLETLVWGATINPLVGIGKREWLTIGTRLQVTYEDFGIYPPWKVFEGFISVHPSRNWSSFIGVKWFAPDFDHIAPYFTLGIGHRLK